MAAPGHVAGEARPAGTGSHAGPVLLPQQELPDPAGGPERLNTVGEDFAGPRTAAYGTDAQQQRFLTPILTGEQLWCQVFSEPESGSDLASLRSRATRVDGGWRISGQKIWTSRVHLADHMTCRGQ